jgi:hypothetical protein
MRLPSLSLTFRCIFWSARFIIVLARWFVGGKVNITNINAVITSNDVIGFFIQLAITFVASNCIKKVFTSNGQTLYDFCMLMFLKPCVFIAAVQVADVRGTLARLVSFCTDVLCLLYYYIRGHQDRIDECNFRQNSEIRHQSAGGPFTPCDNPWVDAVVISLCVIVTWLFTINSSFRPLKFLVIFFGLFALLCDQGGLSVACKLVPQSYRTNALTVAIIFVVAPLFLKFLR